MWNKANNPLKISTMQPVHSRAAQFCRPFPSIRGTTLIKDSIDNPRKPSINQF